MGTKNCLPGFNISPLALIVIWLLLFVICSDYTCPLFHTRYACVNCGPRDGHG